VIRVVVDDLAFVEADAVVRPATSLLEPTQASLRRLDDLAGGFAVDLRAELAVGAAIVTGGGALSVELVIHAIIRSATEPVTALSVERALTSALHRAEAWELGHLAIPPLGTGAGQLGLDAAAAAMGRALVARRGAPYPSEITIVVETEDDRTVLTRALHTEAT
jgi:O-acetyl-ADP-ribose deacetylase (regulator of RNase III)